VLSKLAYLTLCRSIQLLAMLARGDAAKDLEILVLGRQLPCPSLEPTNRALVAAVSRVLPSARWSRLLVRPETLLRWHRRLIAYSARRSSTLSARPQRRLNGYATGSGSVSPTETR
jgi:putative transposase